MDAGFGGVCIHINIYPCTLDSDTTEYKGVVIQSTKYFLKSTEYRVGRDALAQLQVSSRTRPRASPF